jgi:adenylate cyclase class 2
MALEIEKKYPLTAELNDEIRRRLAEVGAAYVGFGLEENTIYRGGALDETGGVVRIRRVDGKGILTYKRRVESVSDAKEQIEIESEVADADAVAEIVGMLGLRPAVIYEKRRDTWKLRDTEIVIDDLPFGLFMEIEGSLTAIKEAEILLEIEDLPTEPRTYPTLTAELGTDVNGVREARF